MSSQKTEAVTNRIFTIPNVISFIRLCMVPVYMVLLLNGYDLLATFMFALAAGTDWIDGQLARRTNCVSKLGQLLDPAVDRILMSCGVIGLMLYNMGAGILRAVGDSKRPFYFLVVSAVLNIILDLVFVLSLGMGVKGVAYATIISQGVSAMLTMITLFRTDSCIKVELKYLKLDKEMLAKIVRVGIPAAIQMAITAFSNVFVQSYVNYFGADCMSGWTAYSKIDQLLFLPMQSLALASTTFVGQNLGIDQVGRAKKGARTAFIMSVVATVILTIPLLIFAPQLVSFFNGKAEVVAYGSMLLRYCSPFYVFCCVNQVYSGVLRGAGNSRAPMIIMLSSFVIFRQIYLFIMANFISNTIIPIALGYPAGWLVCSTLTLLYYRHADLSKSRLVEDAEKKAEASGKSRIKAV